MILEHEIKFYNDNKQGWLIEGLEGKFVLIKNMNDSCEFEVFFTMKEAYEAGVKNYGNVPMLIREIQETEPIHRI